MSYTQGGMNYWTDKSQFHIIAHRGASAYAPDNSLEAFYLAGQYGATAVETDLHSTADGQFVIRHDGLVEPGRFISQLDFASYQKILAKQSEKPLKLKQAIEALRPGGLAIYLEVKHITPSQIPDLLQEIKDANYRDKVAIGSFRTDIVKTVKEVSPRTPTSAIFLSPNMDINSLVLSLGCDFLHPCFDVTHPDPLKYFHPGWVEQARQTGAGIISWNTTDQKVAETIIAMDVDGVCADDPQIIVRALKKIRG